MKCTEVITSVQRRRAGRAEKVRLVAFAVASERASARSLAGALDRAVWLDHADDYEDLRVGAPIVGIGF